MHLRGAQGGQREKVRGQSRELLYSIPTPLCEEIASAATAELADRLSIPDCTEDHFLIRSVSEMIRLGPGYIFRRGAQERRWEQRRGAQAERTVSDLGIKVFLGEALEVERSVLRMESYF